MAHISDEAIKDDICSTLKMWDLFNSLDKEKQDNLIDYYSNPMAISIGTIM